MNERAGRSLGRRLAAKASVFREVLFLHFLLPDQLPDTLPRRGDAAGAKRFTTVIQSLGVWACCELTISSQCGRSQRDPVALQCPHTRDSQYAFKVTHWKVPETL